MRVREAILHSARQPEGAVTMARVVNISKGKRLMGDLTMKDSKNKLTVKWIQEKKEG